MTEIAHLLGEADRAASRGDPAHARTLIERVVVLEPGQADHRLRLAALCRMTGDGPAALAAADAALAIEPHNFMALLMRANLLEAMGHPAGEAYGRALARKPDGPLAPQIAAAAARGETVHAEFLAQAEARLAAAMAPAELQATPDEARRMARFRTNVLRKTRPYHSEPSLFHYPGLVEREFYDTGRHPWIADLEASLDLVAAEFEAVMAAERTELAPYIQYAENRPPDQWGPLNNSRDWTAVHLLRNGLPVGANTRHCPGILALLDRMPQPRIPGCSPNAMFSLLAPDTCIPAHTGYANIRLVCHLPLIVPEGCWFRVGAETRFWERGKALLFDDSIEHEAANPSQGLRVLFIIDVWHPDLSEPERQAIAALMGSSESLAAAAL